ELPQMIRRLRQKALSLVRAAEERLQAVGKSARIAVGKCHAAGADRFRKAAARRADHHATASNPFQRNHTEWLVVAGGDHKDPVLPQDVAQGLATLRAAKADLLLEL